MVQQSRKMSNLKETPDNFAPSTTYTLVVKKKPSPLLIFCVIGIWISCSSITQISNKNVLANGHSPITLVFSQMLCGTLFYFVAMFYRGNELILSNKEKTPITIQKAKVWRMLVGFCNALTHYLTLRAIQMISPALTHIIRGTEPIWMMIFSYIMLKKKSTLYEMYCVTLMILGIISIATNGNEEKKLNTNELFLKGILTTLAANVAIALRNCGSKNYTSLTSKELYYPEVCAVSFLWMLFPTMLQVMFDSSIVFKNYNISPYLGSATVFHVIYSYMSFYVLSFMEPTSHSVVKLVSRTIAVLSLTFVFGIEDTNFPMLFGIILCIVGGFFYSYSSVFEKMHNRYNWKMFLVMVLLTGSSLGGLNISTLRNDLLKDKSIVLDKKIIYSSKRSSNLFATNKFHHEALGEIGQSENFDESYFDFPMIPTGGYRSCLDGKDILKRKRTGQMAYMGSSNASCNGCFILDPSDSFSTLSLHTCMRKALICGRNSTFLCGLLGLSTKTVTYVESVVLNSWPRFMHDYHYGVSAKSRIEYNHRLVFDRHTIKEYQKRFFSHSIRLTPLKSGFNLFLYTLDTKCDKRTDKRHPLFRGNMGDIFGSHLAEYFKSKTGLNYSLICFDEPSNAKYDYETTLALVGSIALKAVTRPGTTLLGVGTISENQLKQISIMAKNVQVLGVRGPRSRDAFLSKFGLNPEVVGDPGLYLYEVFKEQIDKERENQENMKDLCFVSHMVENEQFADLFKEFKNVTISAGGDIEPIIKFISTCRSIVSSSLHGVIFSHALSIPAAPVQVSQKIYGGDWKYFDYYYGINVTTFSGRVDVRETKSKPKTKQEWVDLINEFPQPKLPMNIDRLITFQRFKSLL